MFESFLKKKEPVHKVDMDFPEIKVEKYHTVKVAKMTDIRDVVDVKTALARVDVLLVKINGFKDVEELKRAIARLKLAAAKYGGDVVGIDDNWLIVTTKQTVIER